MYYLFCVLSSPHPCIHLSPSFTSLCVLLFYNNCLIFFVAVRNHLNGVQPTLEQLDDHAIKISWIPKVEIPPELSKYYSYGVLYGMNKDTLPNVKNVTHQANYGNQSTTISGLDLEQSYYFEIIPYTATDHLFSVNLRSEVVTFPPLRK